MWRSRGRAVATSRHAAVDAAEDVIVEHDAKPVVVDPEAALADGSPLVWEQFGTNKTHEWAVAEATSTQARPTRRSRSTTAS